MSEPNSEDAKELDPVNNTPHHQADVDPPVEDSKQSDINEESLMPTPQQEEETVKKKYGGMLPKKPPLISKDHERAFFDSADWALGKQGAQKTKGPLEALRPKLQPTHQQTRARRSAYAPADDGEVDVGNNDDTTSEDQSCALDGGDNNTAHCEDQSCHY